MAAVVAGLSVAAGLFFGIVFSLLDPVTDPAAPGVAVFLAGSLIVAGLGAGWWYYHKAEVYETAQAAYFSKKEAAQSKYGERGENQS